MTSKTFLLIFAAIIGNTGCALFQTKTEETVKGKVYVSDPRQGGIVRAQAGELIPYSKTLGFYCISPSDLEIFLAQWEAAQQCDKQ